MRSKSRAGSYPSGMKTHIRQADVADSRILGEYSDPADLQRVIQEVLDSEPGLRSELAEGKSITLELAHMTPKGGAAKLERVNVTLDSDGNATIATVVAR